MKFIAAVLLTLSIAFTAEAQCSNRSYRVPATRGYNTRFNIQLNRGYFPPTNYGFRYPSYKSYGRNYGYRGTKYSRSCNRYGW